MTCLNFDQSCPLSVTQEPDFTKFNCYIPEVEHKYAVKVFFFFASAISLFPDATFYVHSILPLPSLPYDWQTTRGLPHNGTTSGKDKTRKNGCHFLSARAPQPSELVTMVTGLVNGVGKREGQTRFCSMDLVVKEQPSWNALSVGGRTGDYWRPRSKLFLSTVLLLLKMEMLLVEECLLLLWKRGVLNEMIES